MIDLVFNDLSAHPVAETNLAASSRVTGFIKILLEAPQRGLGKELRIPESFYSVELASNYQINHWIADSSISREEREFILQLATRSPFLQGAREDVTERALRCDVSVDGKDSAALQAAFLMDLPLVSFNHLIWSHEQITAEVEQIDDDLEISNSSAVLINFADTAHFDTHRNWIEQRRKKYASDPTTLWDQHSDFLPNLTFCTNVESQIKAIPAKSDLFVHVLDRLFDLERVAALFEPFDKNAFRTKCSPTSQETFNKFGSHYSFSAPDGNRFLCGWHLRLEDGKRVYFCPSESGFIIGHIGKHLPTVRFPN